MKRAKQTNRAAATVHVIDAAKMSEKQRAHIAAWLRRQADALQAEGTQYAARFRARYLYG